MRAPIENPLQALQRRVAEQAEELREAFITHAQNMGKLRAVLEEVEWIPNKDGEYCPWCDARNWDGHAPDCRRQAALGKDKQP